MSHTPTNINNNRSGSCPLGSSFFQNSSSTKLPGNTLQARPRKRYYKFLGFKTPSLNRRNQLIPSRPENNITPQKYQVEYQGYPADSVAKYQQLYSASQWQRYFDNFQDRVPAGHEHRYDTIDKFYLEHHTVLTVLPYYEGIGYSRWDYYMRQYDLPPSTFADDFPDKVERGKYVKYHDHKVQLFTTLSKFKLLEEYLETLDNSVNRLCEYSIFLEMNRPVEHEMKEGKVQHFLRFASRKCREFTEEYNLCLKTLNTQFSYLSNFDPLFLFSRYNRGKVLDIIDAELPKQRPNFVINNLTNKSVLRKQIREGSSSILISGPLQCRLLPNLQSHSHHTHLQNISKNPLRRIQHKNSKNLQLLWPKNNYLFTRFYINKRPMTGNNNFSRYKYPPEDDVQSGWGSVTSNQAWSEQVGTVEEAFWTDSSDEDVENMDVDA